MCHKPALSRQEEPDEYVLQTDANTNRDQKIKIKTFQRQLRYF